MKQISESRWSELREGRWTAADAAEVLAALAESGESARRFAAEHGLSVQRLYWWRHRLEKRKASAVEEVAAALVPVQLSSDDLREADAAMLHLPRGVVFEVPLSASPAWVAAVVHALSEG